MFEQIKEAGPKGEFVVFGGPTSYYLFIILFCRKYLD